MTSHTRFELTSLLLGGWLVACPRKALPNGRFRVEAEAAGARRRRVDLQEVPPRGQVDPAGPHLRGHGRLPRRRRRALRRKAVSNERRRAPAPRPRPVTARASLAPPAPDPVKVRALPVLRFPAGPARRIPVEAAASSSRLLTILTILITRLRLTATRIWLRVRVGLRRLRLRRQLLERLLRSLGYPTGWCGVLRAPTMGRCV